MIKLLIKHKIAETAINVFFDKVSQNFVQPIPKFKKGQQFTKIRVNLTLYDYRHKQRIICKTYINCTVILIGIDYINVSYEKAINIFSYITREPSSIIYEPDRLPNPQYDTRVLIPINDITEII